MRSNIYTKAVLLLLTVLHGGFYGKAQNYVNDANSTLPGTTTLITLPAANTTPASYNYIRTFVPKIPLTNAAAVTLNGNFDYHATTEYLNGWGQSLQTTIRGNTTGNSDIITPHDLSPSVTKVNYLPYNSGVRSKFRTNRFQEQRTFYNGQHPSEDGASYGLRQTDFSNGTVITKTYQPGKAYAGQGRGTESRDHFGGSYTASLSVDETTGDILYNGSYPFNSLIVKEQKTISHDNGQQAQYDYAYETYDKDGRLICKEVVASSSISTSDILTTYYVYDDMGRLRYLLPPEMVKELQQNSWSFNTLTTPHQAYSYEYNTYGKLIASRKPGQNGFEYYVYDSKQRPVLYQSPLMASRSQWQFSVYDNRDRVIMSGLLDNTTFLNGQNQPYSWQDWQQFMDSPPQIAPPYLTVWWLMAYGFNGQFPTNLAGFDVHQYNYYDSYTDYLTTANPQADQPSKAYYNGFYGDFISGINYAVIPQPYYYVVGSLTASKTKILDPNSIGGYTNQWINNVYYYDQKGRLIQTLTQNPWNANNWDVTAQQYSFSGDPICNVMLHYADSVAVNSNKPQTKVELRTQLYQNGPLASAVQISIDDKPFVNVSAYQYDNMKRTIQKYMGGVNVQNYSYDIRSNLTGINIPHVRREVPFATHMTFAESLHRETGFDHKRYNGKLSGFQWRGASGPPGLTGIAMTGRAGSPAPCTCSPIHYSLGKTIARTIRWKASNTPATGT